MHANSELAKLNDLSKYLLKDKIYQILKTWVLDGTLKPNEQLSSARIAQQLGISKTPVNQAIHRLELEGYVYFNSNQRYYVHSDSKKNIDELSTIRLLLESYAGKLATPNMTTKQIALLEEINKQIYNQLDNFKQAKNTQKFIEEFISRNRQFHDVITDSCGNERLIKLIQDSRERIIVYNLIRHLSFEDFQVSFQDHKELIQCLKKRQEDKVEAVLRRHMERTRTTMLNRMYGAEPSERKRKN